MSANNQYYIYGIHTVLAAISRQPENIINIFLVNERKDKRVQEIIDLARKYNISIQTMQKKNLPYDISEQQHQGVLVLIKSTSVLQENDLLKIIETQKEKTFLLILDSVQDPHNLGACLRTSDAAGVHAVITTKDNAASLNATVRKVASGAAEHVPFVQVTNLATTIKKIKEAGVWVIGADLVAEKNIFNFDFTGPIAIVMGSEGTGMRRLTRDLCDHLINIPMFGSVSSLNVSVATGIFLYAALHQRIIHAK